MKKKLTEEIKVYRAESFKDLPIHQTFPYPYEEPMFDLLKQENSFQQEYYYVERGDSYAFFVVYENKMDIFTFGKMTWFYPVHVIGYPCSLSCPGYVTNDDSLLLDFVKTIKGAKLILNVSKPVRREDYVIGKTLPTCTMKLVYSSIEEYMSHLRSPYRRRIKKAIEACKHMTIGWNEMNDEIYQLYLNTYEKSNYKLEKLEKGFFERIDATKLVFYQDKHPVGLVLLKGNGEELIFMFCGMDYTIKTADLYYYMLYHIIQYGVEHQYTFIDLGQTSEETKMKFGAILQDKYFYAHHTNPLLNFAIRHGKGLLEYHYQFPEFHVFKE